MPQDAMVVIVWINMKSYYDFFQYCVLFIRRIQVCDTKNWKTQKNSWKFVRPKK